MKISPHRATVAHLHRDGVPPRRIAERLKIPHQTVYKVIKQFKELGHVEEKPRTGRPPTVNVPRVRKIIKKRIQRNDSVSLNKIASDLDISRRSVQTIVKNDLGLRSYRLLQGQTLTGKAMENRHKKAKKLLHHLSAGRHHNVLFTDEKVFTVEVALNSQNHRQLLSPADRNSGKRRIRTRTHFPKSMMVWGGITATGKTPLIFIDKGVKINAKYYQEEIMKKVSPIVFFCLLVGSSALQYNLYAQSILGNMEELKVSRYEDAKKDVGNKTGILQTETCAEGRLCVGDAYLFTTHEGKTAGFVWTTCWKQDVDKDEIGTCFWSERNVTRRDWTGGRNSKYRCICDSDNCQTKNHLLEQFDWAYGNYIKSL